MRVSQDGNVEEDLVQLLGRELGRLPLAVLERLDVVLWIVCSASERDREREREGAIDRVSLARIERAAEYQPSRDWDIVCVRV